MQELIHETNLTNGNKVTSKDLHWDSAWDGSYWVIVMRVGNEKRFLASRLDSALLDALPYAKLDIEDGDKGTIKIQPWGAFGYDVDIYNNWIDNSSPMSMSMVTPGSFKALNWFTWVVDALLKRLVTAAI